MLKLFLLVAVVLTSLTAVNGRLVQANAQLCSQHTSTAPGFEVSMGCSWQYGGDSHGRWDGMSYKGDYNTCCIQLSTWGFWEAGVPGGNTFNANASRIITATQNSYFHFFAQYYLNYHIHIDGCAWLDAMWDILQLNHDGSWSTYNAGMRFMHEGGCSGFHGVKDYPVQAESPQYSYPMSQGVSPPTVGVTYKFEVWVTFTASQSSWIDRIWAGQPGYGAIFDQGGLPNVSGPNENLLNCIIISYESSPDTQCTPYP